MLKYNAEYKSEYASRLFIVAGSQNKLIDSFQKILELLGHPARLQQESHLKLEAVRSWLEKQRNWLVMFDNIG